MVRWLVLVSFAVTVALTAVWWAQTEQGQQLLGRQEGADRPFLERVERPQHFEIAGRGTDQVIERLDAAFAGDLAKSANDIERARAAMEILPAQVRATIPAGPESPRGKDVTPAYRQYLQQIETVYREKTVDEGPAREKAEQFLSQSLDRSAGVEPPPDWEHVRNLGEAAVAAGSRDPITRMVLAEMWQWLPEKQRDALELLDQTAEELDAQEYPPLLVMLARHYALQNSKRLNEPPHQTKAREYLLCDAAIEFLARDADKTQGWYTWSMLRAPFTELGNTGQQALCLGALERGVAATFAMQMAVAYTYKSIAWEARGEGFASEVTEEGGKTFARLLPIAGRHFMWAWTLDPRSPDPPTAMIGISMAGGDDRWSPRDWFNVVTRIQLDYEPAYAALRYALTPRWGGSHRQQIAFAQACVETGRWDTMVPWYAMRLVYEIQKERGIENPVGDVPGVVDIIDRFVSGFHQAKAAGTALENGRWTSWHWAYAAAIYAQQGRYEEAHGLFESYGGAMTQDDCDWAHFKLTYLRGLCAAMTGPANEDVARLRTWVEEPLAEDVSADDLDEPLAEVQRLRTIDDRRIVRPYWDDVEAMLKQLQTYHRGEWVNFELDESLPGLYLNADVREFTAEGTLRFASMADSAGCFLRPMAWFAPPIIIEGEFAAWSDHEQDAWIGVMNGSPSRAIYGDENLRGVMLTESRRDAIIHDDQKYREFYRQAWSAIDREFHHLRLRMWPGQVRHECDYAMLKVDDKFDRDVSGWVLFGAHRTDAANSGQMRNLRVRKLDYDPPQTTSDLDEWAAYWERLEEIHPGDASVLLRLGMVAYFREDYEQALALLRQVEEINHQLTGRRYYLGATYLQQGRIAEALPELETAIRESHSDDRARSDVSWILSSAPDASLHDPQRALSLAEQAYELDNDDFHSLRALAGAHARLGDYDAAAKWMTEAIAAITDDDDLRARLCGYLQTIEQGEPLTIVVDQE